MTMSKQLTTMLGSAALVCLPVSAQALEGSCITEAEIGSMAVYSLPNLVQSMQLRCSARLSPGGFLAREGDRFAGRYISLQDAAWPAAKSGFLKFASSKASSQADKLDILATLPDNTVRPLIDALMVQELSGKIATKDCRKFERVMEVLAPIDPKLTGDVVGIVAGLAGLQNPSICPVE